MNGLSLCQLIRLKENSKGICSNLFNAVGAALQRFRLPLQCRLLKCKEVVFSQSSQAWTWRERKGVEGELEIGSHLLSFPRSAGRCFFVCFCLSCGTARSLHAA